MYVVEIQREREQLSAMSLPLENGSINSVLNRMSSDAPPMKKA